MGSAKIGSTRTRRATDSVMAVRLHNDGFYNCRVTKRCMHESLHHSTNLAYNYFFYVKCSMIKDESNQIYYGFCDALKNAVYKCNEEKAC